MARLSSRAEVEQHSLGCAIVNNQQLPLLLAPETRDLFRIRAHRRIHAAIQRLNDRGSRLDLLTLKSELELKGELGQISGKLGGKHLSGDAYLARLVDLVGPSAHLPDYLEILLRDLNEHEEAEAVDGLQRALKRGGLSEEIVTARQRVLSSLQARTSATSFHPTPVDIIELLEKPLPNTTHLAEGLVPTSSLISLAGEAGHGKSLFSEQMALEMVIGLPVFGRFSVNQPLRVCIIDEENRLAELQKRFQRILRCFGRTAEDIGDRLLLYNGAGFRFDEQIRCQELLRRLKDFHPDLVVFDTFRRMHRQDENDSGAIDCLFGEVLLRVRDELGSSVLLLDHLNKAKKRLSRGAGRQRLRGSTAKLAAVDIAWSICENEDLRNDELPKYFQLFCDKDRGGDDTVVSLDLVLAMDQHGNGPCLVVEDRRTLSSPRDVRKELVAIVEELGGSAPTPSIIARAREKSLGSEKMIRAKLKSMERRELEVVRAGRGRANCYTLRQAALGVSE